MMIQNVVNTASFLGLAKKSFHVGGIKINGEISNSSAKKNTVTLNVSASRQWKSVQVKAKSNGVVNFKTGKVIDGSTSLDMTFPINDNLQLNGGLRSSTQEESNGEFENAAYIKIKLTSGTTSLSVLCSVTNKLSNPLNKECTASASFNF